MLAHVRQPDDRTCAPAAVAMITGAPIDELIAEMRPGKRGTPHRRLISALRARGVRCGDRFVSVRGRDLPRVAIVRITWPDRTGHVVVKDEHRWLDPSLPRALDCCAGWPSPQGWAWFHGRITSSLWIDQ